MLADWFKPINPSQSPIFGVPSCTPFSQNSQVHQFAGQDTGNEMVKFTLCWIRLKVSFIRSRSSLVHLPRCRQSSILSFSQPQSCHPFLEGTAPNLKGQSCGQRTILWLKSFKCKEHPLSVWPESFFGYQNTSVPGNSNRILYVVSNEKVKLFLELNGRFHSKLLLSWHHERLTIHFITFCSPIQPRTSHGWR